MIDRLDLWLVDNWRTAWRWWSVQMHMAASLVALALETAPVLPPEVSKLIWHPYAEIATGLWTAAGLWARLKKQTAKVKCDGEG